MLDEITPGLLWDLLTLQLSVGQAALIYLVRHVLLPPVVRTC